MTLDEINEKMETGEEFELQQKLGVFKFMNGNIYITSYNGTWALAEMNLNLILNATLVCKPWKPKLGDTYWWWMILPGSIRPYSTKFIDHSGHYEQIAFGNCFRTRSECEKHTEMRDKLIEMRKEYI